MIVKSTRSQAQLLRADFNEAWFETVFQAVDRLHDEVSGEHRLRGASSLPAALMVGWLEDIIYTAQEALREIRAKTPVTEADATPISAGYRSESEG
jgi:hypothetical protein